MIPDLPAKEPEPFAELKGTIGKRPRATVHNSKDWPIPPNEESVRFTRGAFKKSQIGKGLKEKVQPLENEPLPIEEKLG
jgi:hypothetical protein